MNPNDSARIARIYAMAALIFSTCLGLAALIAVVPWELIFK